MVLNPTWYVQNIAQEFHRYGPGLGRFGGGWLLRPGFWTMVIALPLSLVALARGARRDSAARAIVVPGLLFPALFAAFITLKLVNYTLIELPLFALAIGWGVCALWSKARWRPLVVALGMTV